MPPSAWWPYSARPGCVSCIGIMYIICLLIFVREWETCFQSRSCPLTCRLCMLVFESCRTEKHWLHLSQHVCLRVMEQAEAARPVLSRRFAFKSLCPLCEHKDLHSLWNFVCVCARATQITIWAVSKCCYLLEWVSQFLNTFCEFV